MKICFAASSGGHLEQLMMLHPMMKEHDSFILTEKTSYQFNSKEIKHYDVVQINRREFSFLLNLLFYFSNISYLIKRETRCCYLYRCISYSSGMFISKIV